MIDIKSLSDGCAMFILTTQRLSLSPHDPTRDADGLASILGDEEVMRHIGAGAMSPEAIANYLRRHADMWLNTGMGGWTLRRSEDDAVLGNIFLKPVRDLPEIEVGYTLGRQHWGHGYAYEALTEVVRHGRGRGIDRIVALVRPENVRSTRLLLRCGFAFDAMIPIREKLLELYVIQPRGIRHAASHRARELPLRGGGV